MCTIAQIEFMCVLHSVGACILFAAAAMVIQLAQRDASGYLGDDPDDQCPICTLQLRVRSRCVMCGSICHLECGVQDRTTGWQFHCALCLDDVAYSYYRDRSRARDDHAMLDDGGDGEHADDDARDDNGDEPDDLDDGEPDDEPELDDDDDIDDDIGDNLDILRSMMDPNTIARFAAVHQEFVNELEREELRRLGDGEPDDEPDLDDDDDGDDDSTIASISEQDRRANAAAAWEWIIDLNRMQLQNPPQSHADAVEELRRLERDAALARESQERHERLARTREGFGPFGPSTLPGEVGATVRDDRGDGDDGEAVNDDGVDELLAVLES